jgi:hypothetical protein
MLWRYGIAAKAAPTVSFVCLAKESVLPDPNSPSVRPEPVEGLPQSTCADQAFSMGSPQLACASFMIEEALRQAQGERRMKKPHNATKIFFSPGAAKNILKYISSCGSRYPENGPMRCLPAIKPPFTPPLNKSSPNKLDLLSGKGGTCLSTGFPAELSTGIVDNFSVGCAG